MPAGAIEKAVKKAVKQHQQDADDTDSGSGGWEIGQGSAEKKCGSCGEPGVFVSQFNVGDAGPLTFDEYTCHVHQGAAYYHVD